MKSLLAKPHARIHAHQNLKKTITEVLTRELGVELARSAVRIKHGTIFISGHPALKNEIQLKKEKIISLLKEGVGGWVPDDIK